MPPPGYGHAKDNHWNDELEYLKRNDVLRRSRPSGTIVLAPNIRDVHFYDPALVDSRNDIDG
jgi:hypothetical protein